MLILIRHTLSTDKEYLLGIFITCEAEIKSSEHHNYEDKALQW